MASIPWYSPFTLVPEQQLKVDIFNDALIFNDDDTLILITVIEFGALDAVGNPTALKYKGAGKIYGAGWSISKYKNKMLNF